MINVTSSALSAITEPIRRNLSYVTLSFGLYIVGFVIGGTIGFVYSPDLSFYANGAPTVHDSSHFSVTTVLFTNLHVIIMLAGGAVSMGVSTVPTLLLNGLVLGYSVTTIDNLGIISTVLLFLPHVVLELPGYWLAGALGVKYPVEAGKYIFGRQEHIFSSHDIRDAIVLFFTATVLIVSSAFVEVIITPRIALQ